MTGAALLAWATQLQGQPSTDCCQGHPESDGATRTSYRRAGGAGTALQGSVRLPSYGPPDIEKSFRPISLLEQPAHVSSGLVTGVTVE